MGGRVVGILASVCMGMLKNLILKGGPWFFGISDGGVRAGQFAAAATGQTAATVPVATGIGYELRDNPPRMAAFPQKRVCRPRDEARRGSGLFPPSLAK